MASINLSAFERSYIICGVQEGVRADGREAKAYRHFDLTTGVISNTSGSAEIKMVDGLVFIDLPATIFLSRRERIS